jgi:hypothetical protein
VLSGQARAALGTGAAGSGGLLHTVSPTVRAHVAGPLANAFANTFWWALAATLIALVPASVLAVTQRHERHPTDAGDGRDSRSLKTPMTSPGPSPSKLSRASLAERP